MQRDPPEVPGNPPAEEWWPPGPAGGGPRDQGLLDVRQWLPPVSGLPGGQLQMLLESESPGGNETASVRRVRRSEHSSGERQPLCPRSHQECLVQKRPKSSHQLFHRFCR